MELFLLIGLWFFVSVPVSLIGVRIASLAREPEYAWYSKPVESYLSGD